MNDNNTIEELNEMIAERDKRIASLELQLDRAAKLLLSDTELAFSKETQ